MTKYDRLKFKQIQERDKLILEELDRIFKSIQEKSKKLASNVYQKSEGNENYFTDRPSRKKSFAKTVNEELKPDYIKKDKFMYDRYAEEYRTTYLYDKFVFESNALLQGFKITIPRYQKKQFVKALENPISKLANTAELATDRAVNLQQIYKTIVTGVETGQSLDNIVKNIDVNLGYRDRQTLKVIAKPEAYKGQFYRSKRILRTEVGRIRSEADRDRWINTQDIAPSKMQLVETLDNRTRSQSANMDGQFANEEGKFKYPDEHWYYLKQSGHPEWDIFDRGRTINIDPEYPPESRLEKDKNGNYQEKPFNNFKDYAERNGLKRNKYGEVLFGQGRPNSKPKKRIVKKPSKTAPKKTAPKTRTKSTEISNILKSTNPLDYGLKKSEAGINISKNISKEFNIPLSDVFRVESNLLNKNPKKRLKIDELRMAVVNDISEQVKLLQKKINKLSK